LPLIRSDFKAGTVICVNFFVKLVLNFFKIYNPSSKCGLN